MFGLLLSLALGAPGDLDDDGVVDDDDNCPGLPNADQVDANNDGWGDACVDVTAFVHPSATLGLRTRVTGDAMVGARSVLGDDVSIVGSVLGRLVDVGDGVRITDSVLLRAATVEAGAMVIDSTFGPFAFIGAGARMTRVIGSVWADIGRDAVLTDAALGWNAVVGAETQVSGVVSPGGIVGFGSTIGSGAVLRSRVTVAAGATVGAGARVGRYGVVTNGVSVGAGARVRSGAWVSADVSAGEYVPRAAVRNHPTVLLDLVVPEPETGLDGAVQAFGRAFDREGDAFEWVWSADGAWQIDGDGASVSVVSPSPDAVGFDDTARVRLAVVSADHEDVSSADVVLTAESTCEARAGGTGATWLQIPGSEREWYRAWCDMQTAGGGWTVLHPDDHGHLGLDPDSLRDARDEVLVWILRNDGAEFTTLMEQLPQWAQYELNVEERSTHINVEFIPVAVAAVQGQTQGVRSNGQNLTFTNCDANPNSYLRFYRTGQVSGHTPSTNDYAMSYRWRDTKVPAVSGIPADFYAFTEFHQGGCGTFSTSNRWSAYDGTTAAALGFR